jgi:hypothetical protein
MPYGTAILLVAGVGGSVWSGDLEGFSIGNSWFWAEWTGYTIPFAWAGVEAHGTLRIALKAAGLEPNHLTGARLRVVFEKVMPGELDSRGVSDVPDACATVLATLESAGGAAADADATSPDEIFRRLAGG